MEKLVKQCFVVYEENKPVACYNVKAFKSDDEYYSFIKLCEENKRELKQKAYEKEEALYTRIALLERELHNVKLELAYNRGEITEKEFNDGMVR